MRQTAVVICPGRGTYTKTELGYLNRHRSRSGGMIGRLDQFLADRGEPTVSSLDGAAKFSLKTHTPGEYASTLIYACSAADFAAIDPERFEVVAVTGNSMGWYSALGVAGALEEQAAFNLIHTMGSMMRNQVIGGQLIYPVVDAQWQPSKELEALVAAAVHKVAQQPGAEAHHSIHFGGYAIIGGNELALAALMKELPSADEGKYPFILVNHAAFHTPMMAEVALRAQQTLGLELFRKPTLPLIDGRGVIWQPYGTDVEKLRDYTLGHQVTQTYDFSTAVEVALKEFAPDCVILLGPGATSGGAIAQTMIRSHWLGLSTKADFSQRQAESPYLLAMGREDQARLVARP